MKRFIVVLGGGIESKKNNLPNNWTRLRFDKAMEVYSKSSEDSVLILTTGRTYRLSGGTCTEARVGKNYLLNHYKGQINSENIILEEDSKDTLSNAYYVAKILTREKVNSFHVVTSGFHMEKSRYIFEEIVFPRKDGWKISFHKSPNGDIDEKILQRRLNSERHVLDFYKKHLENTFGVVPGDMNTMENFILNVSKAYNLNNDEPHQESLTRKIKEVNQGLENPLY